MARKLRVQYAGAIYHGIGSVGRRLKRTLENDTFTVYDHDAASQMTGITHQKIGPMLISSHTYGYDDAGQRLWVKRANGQGDGYAYDPTAPLIPRQDAKTQSDH